MSAKPIADILTELGACREAVEWSKAYGADTQKAWNECQRGDYLLWILCKHSTSGPWSDDRKPLIACAVDCALTAKHIWPHLWSGMEAEQISAIVHGLQAWTKGEVTTEQAKKAMEELLNYLPIAPTYAITCIVYVTTTAYAFAADCAARAAADAADIIRKHYHEPPMYQARLLAKSE